MRTSEPKTRFNSFSIIFYILWFIPKTRRKRNRHYWTLFSHLETLGIARKSLKHLNIKPHRNLGISCFFHSKWVMWTLALAKHHKYNWFYVQRFDYFPSVNTSSRWLLIIDQLWIRMSFSWLIELSIFLFILQFFKWMERQKVKPPLWTLYRTNNYK